MNFFDRLSTGWRISMSSFKVLRENKQLILFPVLSGISLLLLMASFATAIFAAVGWDVEGLNQFNDVTGYIIMFLFYVVNYFVVVFFNTALVYCAGLYFKGEEVTIRKGIDFSMSRIGTIFSWAVFAATIGFLLRMIQENVGILGKIITGIIGFAWGAVTYFVVPVIAYENLSPLAAVKRSASIIKDKWGESAGAGFSFGLFTLVGLIVVPLPLFLVGSAVNPVLGFALAFLGVLFISAIVSAVRSIFLSAVYHNVTGDPVELFNDQYLDTLFVQK